MHRHDDSTSLLAVLGLGPAEASLYRALLRMPGLALDSVADVVGGADERAGRVAVDEVVWAEKRREDWMRRTNGGYGMSRVVWSEMFGVERRRTQRRLRAEFADTLRRFGPLAA